MPHIAYCSTVYDSHDVEATQYPSTGEWMKKMWYIYKIEYYSVFKKNVCVCVCVCVCV